jgi:D-methionine transport system permease protein
MAEFLSQIMPNVMEKLPKLYSSIQQTLLMVGWSGSISFVIGLFFGILITISKPGNIMENKIIYHILDKVVNFFRSIPFIILMVGLFSLSRLIMGTAIGVKGAIIPLIFGCVPFFTRQTEAVFAEVSPGLIEAAQSMGSSNLEIIFRVYLKESIAGLARATTITIINLIGLSAMAGAVGAGGLGDFAISYGHQRHQNDIIYVTIIILVIMVNIIQLIGNYIEKKNIH